FIARLAWMRNRVKGPPQLPRMHIERANIAGRRRVRFRISPANNNQVLVHNARCGQRNRLLLIIAPRIIAQPFAQINAACLAKLRNRLARAGIQTVHEIHDPRKDAFIVPVSPISNAAGWLRPADPRIELPLQLSRCCVESDNFLCRRIGVQSPAHNQWIILEPTLFAGIEAPGDLELSYICPVNLFQAGVVVCFGSPVIGGPADRALRSADYTEEGRKKDQSWHSDTKPRMRRAGLLKHRSTSR